MTSKRKSSKSDTRGEYLIEELPKTKKSRVSGKKNSVPQDGVVENNTVFGQLLKMAGIILKAGERQNEIAVDGAIFQKKLHQAFRTHPSYPQIIEEFISGLESHIENRDQFRNCLLPCVPVQSQETSNAIHSYCESLIKLLLGIEILQPPIVRLLFEKLPEFFHESVGSDGLNLPRLIINQLKWLDRIVDSKDLVSTIMQMICVSPPPIQHDIIISLPEVLEDAQHSEIARELSSLLKEKTELTVPILDALSSLNLDLKLLAEVRQSIMITVAAVKMEDLPVVVKFVLRSIKATDAIEVLSDLRKKVDLDSCVSLPQMHISQSKLRSQPQMGLSASQVSTNQDCMKLFFEVIKSAVKFEKTVLEGWIKAIENVASLSDHKVLDLIVLLIIYATNAKSKKQVERVLKNKIRLGCMREQLLQSAFRYHSPVMRDLFPAILSLAEDFVHSADLCIVSFGSCMYKQAFTSFDSYCQQEVVGAMVTHACGGNSVESDVSLDMLTDLVSQHTSSIAPYAVFLKSILDYMDNLSPQQIRKLFHVLSVLAFSQGHKSGHIQDDMHMVIRKQLSSTIPKYKRIGIIGAITMVGSMAAKRSKENGKVLERAQLNKDQYRQITSLLELVCSCCAQVPEALALYYDELASLIQKGNLDLQILEWMGKSVTKDFERDFVTDLVTTEDSSFLFPVKALYSLEEEDSEATIAINLLPLVSQSYLCKNMDEIAEKSKEKRLVSPVCLSPFFRLLRLCVSELNNGNLEDIDALLVCPLYLTNLEVGGKLESLSKQEREFLCSLLFYTLNWFREVVNAFCQQKDPEIKGRVLSRLQNMTELQCLLEKHLAASPGYIPPLANFDSEPLEGAPAVSSGIGASKKKSKGEKLLKSDSSKHSSAESSQLDENIEANQPESETSQLQKDSPEKEQGTPLVHLQSYRACFRELDLDVFAILHSGLLTRSLLDTEMHTKIREVIQIGPAELLFLLEDLCRKLEYMLIPAPTKRPPFLKGKGNRSVGFSHLCQKTTQEVIEFAVDLLKPLCNHMENMHDYFQVLTAKNHGVVDGPGVNIQEYHLMSTCYQHLLQVFCLLFAWSGFSQHEHHSLLKVGLHALAERLKPGERELPLEELLSQSFQYLLNFQSSVPTIHCALSLTQLLLVIAERSVVNLKKNEIASLTKSFLCQSWVQPNGTRQKGTQFNDSLHTLFCIYMEHTDNILKAIEDISSIGIPELMASKDGYSSTYPTLTRQTFPIFFRAMMAQLENSVKSIHSGTPSDSSEVQLEKLLQWNMAVRDFHILVNLVKVFDSRPVLSVCLKYGRLFVETFLKHGMPLLDCSFKKHRADVQSLLKTLQQSTRQLHHMCGHSKIHQDTGLTSHVPLLKKSLELFVYRVKAMLALNHCQEAFWVGVLKNRDLQGEEILSQASQASEMEEEEEISMITREAPPEEQRQEEDSESEDIIDPKDSDEDSSD